MEKEKPRRDEKRNYETHFFFLTLTVVKLISSVRVTFEQESIHILYFKVSGVF